MGTACVTKRIEATASSVWSHLSWFGVARLSGGTLFKAVDFEGDEVAIGAVRVLHLHDALPVRERLERFDEETMMNVYRVIDNGSLPVTDYEGYIRVTPCGDSACHAKISSTFSAVGIPDEDWRMQWEDLETRLLEDIAGRVVR